MTVHSGSARKYYNRCDVVTIGCGETFADTFLDVVFIIMHERLARKSEDFTVRPILQMAFRV